MIGKVKFLDIFLSEYNRLNLSVLMDTSNAFSAANSIAIHWPNYWTFIGQVVYVYRQPMMDVDCLEPGPMVENQQEVRDKADTNIIDHLKQTSVNYVDRL